LHCGTDHHPLTVREKIGERAGRRPQRTGPSARTAGRGGCRRWSRGSAPCPPD
jgi:hypothetical protein